MKTYSAWKVVIIVVLMCAAFAISSSAQTLTTIYDFCSQTGCADGGSPFGGLVQGSDGNFYGAASNWNLAGYGTVYKLTASGTFTVLHTFTDESDGAAPYAGLVKASDGNFYGNDDRRRRLWPGHRVPGHHGRCRGSPVFLQWMLFQRPQWRSNLWN